MLERSYGWSEKGYPSADSSRRSDVRRCAIFAQKCMDEFTQASAGKRRALQRPLMHIKGAYHSAHHAVHSRATLDGPSWCVQGGGAMCFQPEAA